MNNEKKTEVPQLVQAQGWYYDVDEGACVKIDQYFVLGGMVHFHIVGDEDCDDADEWDFNQNEDVRIFDTKEECQNAWYDLEPFRKALREKREREEEENLKKKVAKAVELWNNGDLSSNIIERLLNEVDSYNHIITNYEFKRKGVYRQAFRILKNQAVYHNGADGTTVIPMSAITRVVLDEERMMVIISTNDQNRYSFSEKDSYDKFSALREIYNI